MVCAIVAIVIQGQGVEPQPPYNLFLAAQHYIDGVILLGSIDSIQTLLLYARFGIYYHIDSSIWEIASTCMRLCVELELHLFPRIPVLTITEQHQRLIFWECYVMDRHASSTLGRPFAISDDNITVDLPVRFDDSEIIGLPQRALSSPSRPPIDDDVPSSLAGCRLLPGHGR